MGNQTEWYGKQETIKKQSSEKWCVYSLVEHYNYKVNTKKNGGQSNEAILTKQKKNYYLKFKFHLKDSKYTHTLYMYVQAHVI